VTIFLAIVQTLVGLLAPAYMLIFVWAIKWDAEPSYLPGRGPDDGFDPSFTRRGHLPPWLDWAGTPDMPFPGGVYEAAIKSALGKGGRLRELWASYLWTGHRNRAHGLAAMFGHVTTDFIPDPFSLDRDRTGWTQAGQAWRFARGEDWQVWRKLGPVFLVYGYDAHKLIDGSFLAYRFFTFKMASRFAV
jgi:hypothetical protein